uniref:TNFR-Cys domain-containing protein n=1 Tax=Esox lucius TaxID=8010 RepID=A0A3P9A1C8_ESOLU
IIGRCQDWRQATPLTFMILLNIKSSAACNPDEYRIGVECCPMCSPGNHVYRHCTEYTSTSCVPCIGSTYLDKPNGLSTCIPCTHCDPGFGLIVKHPCRPSSDTVCEPLKGFYCTDPTKDGTPSTDTVCVDCTGDTYSDGSFTSCQPHTQCDTLNLQEIKPGTFRSNSECGPKTSSLIPVTVSTVLVLIFLITGTIIFILIRKNLKNEQTSTEYVNAPSPTHNFISY